MVYICRRESFNFNLIDYIEDCARLKPVDIPVQPEQSNEPVQPTQSNKSDKFNKYKQSTQPVQPTQSNKHRKISDFTRSRKNKF